MSTLITVAPTGAETAKADCPALPTTLDELAETAVRCERAGAAMIHLHVRDADHQPTLDPVWLSDAVAAVRESTSLIVQLSTGGSVHDPLDQRLAVLDAAPDSCSLTMGTVNFGDDVFANPWPFITELYQRSIDRQVVPEFELFDLGHVAALRRLLDRHGLPYGQKVHVDFVLGVPGGMPGSAATLAAAIAGLPPEVTSFSATGIGRTHLPVLLASLSHGGHLRVGMEDCLTLGQGRPVSHNAELVERAAQIATLTGRPPMGVANARTMIGLDR